jgi:hypothetical protein
MSKKNQIIETVALLSDRVLGKPAHFKYYVEEDTNYYIEKAGEWILDVQEDNLESILSSVGMRWRLSWSPDATEYPTWGVSGFHVDTIALGPIKRGDCFFLSGPYNVGGIDYPTGTLFICNTDNGTTGGSWQRIADWIGVLNLISNYELLSNKVTDFSTINNTLYPTTQAVYDEIISQITALVNSSPATLDTLNELATALGNDPNFATSMATALGLRELLSNKDTDGTLSSNSDVKYPSQKAVKTYVDTTLSGNSSFIPSLQASEVFRGVTYRNGSTTEDVWGGVTMTNDASAAAKTIASTNYLTSKIRKGFYHTVTSTGHMMDMRYAGSLFYLGAGFRFVCSFGIPDTVHISSCRQFHGMQGSTIAPVYSDTVQVDSMTNIIGVGSEGSDTNLHIFHNDASGVATKVDLGVNFPANRTSGAELTTMYSVELYNALNSTEVKYRVVNGESGEVAEGTISTNLPLTTQSLTFVSSRCMGSGGGNTNSGRLDLGQLGVYSTY